MKGVFVSLLSLSLFAFTSFAKPVPIPKPEDHDEWLEDLEKRAGTYAITGAPNGNAPRLEIHDFMFNHPWQFALFMGAMARFQGLNQGSQFSYYLIAGIHGVPNVPWDGVNANPNSNGAVGYCTHSTPIFPCWHRPYTALFEMQFYVNCQAVAAQFRGTQWETQINTALKTIKMPYWDWAAAPPSGYSTFPALFSSPTWNYLTPTGSKNMPNPMYQYNFHPLNANDMIYQPWSEWSYTRRYPTSDSDPNAQSQNSYVTSQFQQQRVNLRDNVYNMFTSCGDWNEFSNDGASSSTPGCHTSLEGIHDNIHSWVGGFNDGHMTYLWWAAFDPVFWMHHFNVDRLFAMWQVIYPGSYVGGFNAPGSTFTIAKGQYMDGNSHLDPFHSNTNGGSWTCNSVRNVGVFKYTYPELQQANGNSNTMKSIVTKLYGPDSPSNSKAKRSTSAGTNFEYIANVQSPRFTVAGGSSYQISFFYGPPPSENPKDWITAPNLIGSQGVFSQPGMTQNNISITGAVPLTTVLQSKLSSGILSTLNSEVVVPLLKMFLEWRVATSDGKIIDPDSIDGFLVSVVFAEVTPPSASNPFPEYSTWTSLGNITHGKPGGLPFGGKCAGEL